MENFSNFLHNGELKSFTQKVTGKKIIWSNLFKLFKDTISKTNTCFRQHHDLEPKTFQEIMVMSFQGKLFKKDSVEVIKTQKSHHKTKFFVICNNPRIASTKTQSIFCYKNVFCERQDSILNISWYQNWDIWVLLKLNPVSKLLNLWKQPKGHKNLKNCQERGDRSLISHPSLFKIRVTLSETRSFLRQIITSDIWN